MTEKCGKWNGSMAFGHDWQCALPLGHGGRCSPTIDAPAPAVVVADDGETLREWQVARGISERDVERRRQRAKAVAAAGGWPTPLSGPICTGPTESAALARAHIIDRAELVGWLREYDPHNPAWDEVLWMMRSPLRALLDGGKDDE